MRLASMQAVLQATEQATQGSGKKASSNGLLHPQYCESVYKSLRRPTRTIEVVLILAVPCLGALNSRSLDIAIALHLLVQHCYQVSPKLIGVSDIYKEF